MAKRLKGLGRGGRGKRGSHKWGCTPYTLQGIRIAKKFSSHVKRGTRRKAKKGRGEGKKLPAPEGQGRTGVKIAGPVRNAFLYEELQSGRERDQDMKRKERKE